MAGWLRRQGQVPAVLHVCATNFMTCEGEKDASLLRG